MSFVRWRADTLSLFIEPSTSAQQTEMSHLARSSKSKRRLLTPNSQYLGAVDMHYHIRWSTVGLDWESFGSSAEASAKQLVRPSETYTIEEYGSECARCRDALNAKSERIARSA